MMGRRMKAAQIKIENILKIPEVIAVVVEARIPLL